MRDVPAALQAKLDNGATTLCSCWRIDPHGSPPLGFTDHDTNISFEGVDFEAESGFDAGNLERSLGLSVDNAEATGALRSDRIDETDIQRGRYDGAEVRQWVVDWTDPELRLLNFRGEIGEIRRGPLAFEVEIRGLSDRLNRPVGRNFLHVCDAVLGDGRCAVDLSDPAYRGVGVVTEIVDRRTVRVSGLEAFAKDWFVGGAVDRAVGKVGVRSQRTFDQVVELEFDRDLVDPFAVGDEVEVTAGCDKRFDTCRGKFANALNFRGFPFIPGETWLAAYPAEGRVNDGGSRNGG